jgi:hypothetical protein
VWEGDERVGNDGVHKLIPVTWGLRAHGRVRYSIFAGFEMDYFQVSKLAVVCGPEVSIGETF